MHEAHPSSSPALVVPAWRERPRWYVTNGDAVVGPVATGLLLRGIVHGRVREEHYVAQYAWSNWREQSYVREIAALRRLAAPSFSALDPEAIKRALRAPRLDTAPLELLTTRDAVLQQALRSALRATQASVGAVHGPREPHVGLVTSWTEGPGMALSLGEVVPWHDEARIVAACDRALIGDPQRDVWARASARRLSLGSKRVAGVALVSMDFGGVRGLLELGRYDHTFRQSDLALLEDVQSSVALRLAQLAD